MNVTQTAAHHMLTVPKLGSWFTRSALSPSNKWEHRHTIIELTLKVDFQCR